MILLLTIKFPLKWYIPLANAVDETQSEEEPSESKISPFSLPFLYMLIEKLLQLGHTSSNCHFTHHTHPIQVVYKQIMYMRQNGCCSYRFYVLTTW